MLAVQQLLGSSAAVKLLCFHLPLQTLFSSTCIDMAASSDTVT